MLDDIGTKAGTPPMEPTLIMETSPGNYQWVYYYSDFVTPEWGAGMATAAAAAANLGDPFVRLRSHHWWRLPGSLPADKRIEREDKARKEGVAPDYTPARLVWASWKTFTYAEVAAGLGIDPKPEETKAHKGSIEYDAETGEQDVVLQWYRANHKVGRPDRRGWHKITCPNHEQHTNQRETTAGYVPPNAKSRGAFKCQHAHCDGVKMAHLRRWVASQGGPTVAEAEAYARRVEPPVVVDMPLTDLPPGALPIGSEHLLPMPPRAIEPRTLDLWPASTLHGLSVPPRQWHVQDMVPDATVTLLGGDGGTGKSLLALQLAVATALGRKWVGIDARQGAALYVSAEDDKAELHRRLSDIARAEDVALSDLSGLHVASLAGEDALLATAEPNGVMIATQLLDLVRERVEALRPKLIVLDTLADLFGGNENDRSQARQFIGMLRGIAIKFQCAVVVLSHPSLTGMASGTGSSGSTGWNNSVRSRLYLSRPDDEDGGDTDGRVLQVKKANYGPVGDEVALRWVKGVFIKSGGAGFVSADGAYLGDVVAEEAFLKLLDEMNKQDRRVSSSGGKNYAPSLFATNPDNEGVSKKRFQRAMERLLASGRIEITKEGPPSKRVEKIQKVTKTDKSFYPEPSNGSANEVPLDL
ncbi:MAG: AAA family ATPase [Tateyamaria sp.]|uniref:AAA family ATPase n=1 Tax=Tateyamaria sp. TaxID=1929288 RepID=UPI0032756774